MTATGETVATTDEGAAALATVLRVAEAGDGTVCWRDVRGDVSSDRWGELLAEGVLVPVPDDRDPSRERSDGPDRFVFDDPVAVERTLAERDFEPPEPDGWSRRDVAAGLGAASLVAGYQVSTIRGIVAGVLDVAVGPFAAALPFPALVLLLAVATTVAATLVRRRFDPPSTDAFRHRTRELEARQEAARSRGDDAAADRLSAEQRDLLADQAVLLTTHLKVVAWTLLLTVPVFLYLSWVVASPARATAPLITVAPVLGDIVWTARLVGPIQAWMTWYALCSLASNLVVRRVVPDRFGASAS